MSHFTNLTLILSLAACEHAAPSQPEYPSQPAAAVPAPKPAEPASPTPAIAPVAPQAVVAPKKLVQQKNCNPMSRAGCRWVEEADERAQPRVVKKEAPQ